MATSSPLRLAPRNQLGTGAKGQGDRRPDFDSKTARTTPSCSHITARSHHQSQSCPAVGHVKVAASITLAVTHRAIGACRPRSKLTGTNWQVIGSLRLLKGAGVMVIDLFTRTIIRWTTPSTHVNQQVYQLANGMITKVQVAVVVKVSTIVIDVIIMQVRKVALARAKGTRTNMKGS